MSTRNLDKLLRPGSIAVIGASDRPGSIGAIVLANIRQGGFEGPIWPVNPRHERIGGLACYDDVAALPAAPDLAVIATPPDTLPQLIGALGGRGCRAAVVITAGIRGAVRQAMLDAARPHLLRIQGPNCLGLMAPHVGLNASFSHIAARPGRLAFLSQSGALITGIVDWADSREIGFSQVVSLGDMADVDFGDMLDYLAGDAATSAVLLYMESVTSAPKFMSAARHAARAKPVVVVKAGRQAAGAAAALSHTGALAGADQAYGAAFRRAGLLRVGELTELFSAAEMLSRVPSLDGERLAILTNGGGAGVLAADRHADLGGALASLSPDTVAALDKVLPETWSRGNPVDIIGDAGPDRYEAALGALLEDEGVDAVLAINCPTALAASLDSAVAVTRAVAGHRSRGRGAKPVLTNWLGEGAAAASRRHFVAAGIPTFETPAAAVGGFAQVVRYKRAQDELMATPPSLPGDVLEGAGEADRLIDRAVSSGRRLLTEPEAKAVFEAYRLPVVTTVTAETPEDAAALAGPIIAEHGAAVLKILSRDIAHKSDVGGVRLDLESAGAVREAAAAMLARARRAMPEARLDGFTVQAMIRRPNAHELICGMTVDPTFGPLVMFGAGGVGVEVMRDVAYALPPLDLNLARDLIRQTRVAALLAGYRDRPAVAIEALGLALVRLSYLVARHPQIREVDVNPLIADVHGVLALDARIVVDDERLRPRIGMVIRPYPSEWERTVTIGDGRPLRLRPIRPDDEALYEAFFAGTSMADRRLRFFAMRQDFSHRFLARLTQIDYAREMAFIAIDETGGMLGVSRLLSEPDLERGEFAVLVRSDMQGRGVGWALMGHLIEYARSSGYREMFGHILRENATMLRLCEELGFALDPAPGEPAEVFARLDLAA